MGMVACYLISNDDFSEIFFHIQQSGGTPIKKYRRFCRLSNLVKMNLQGSLQIYHVCELLPTLKNRVIIVVDKKVFYNIRTNKTAFFIKRNG